MLEVKLELRPNGKPAFKLSKDVSGSIGRFQCKKNNLFLIEQNIRSPHPINERRFIMSIRNDGIRQNEGEHKLSQIQLNEYEMKLLRDSIDDILNYGKSE